MLIGTHALFQKNIKFKKLGLAVIDEQHKFGVKQRSDLANKGGDDCDVLTNVSNTDTKNNDDVIIW